MAVGQRGTLVINRQRIVRPGGLLKWCGQTFQHDRLIPHAGKPVIVHDIEGELHVYECFIERHGRWYSGRNKGRPRYHQVKGEFLCYLEWTGPDKVKEAG